MIRSIKDTKNFINDQANHAFYNHSFFSILENSGSIGGESGWNPIFFETQQNSLYTFLKYHSYGEYTFDWSWAEAYQRHGVNYYPKLTSMIPHTPATTNHLSSLSDNSLWNNYHDFYREHQVSSSHFLYLTKNEISFFRSKDYILRKNIQYHFLNRNYSDFSAFLSQLKSKKAKQIRKERVFQELEIKAITKDDLTQDHAKQMYEFYLKTCQEKNAIPYLTKDFFLQIFALYRNQTLYVQATIKGEPIAGSLFFYDTNTIYGRYWGAMTHIPNLHFELCYYQGIDFCLKMNLSKFEAGAQGEHKIARGFDPTFVYSAHHIKHEVFRASIKQFIEQESLSLDRYKLDLDDKRPYKKTSID